MIVRSSVFLPIVLLLTCGRFEGACSFLREPPNESLVPGRYLADASAEIRLAADGSFTLKAIPESVFFADVDRKGALYEGRGTWSVIKDQSVYAARLVMLSSRRTGPALPADIHEPSEMRLTLVKGEGHYDLCAPVFDGEFSCVYFRRKATP